MKEKKSVQLIKDIEKRLESYQDFLDDLANQEPVSSEIISNKNTAHASILMATLLANTEHSMSMYCTGLRPDLLCGKKEGDGGGFEGAYWEEFKKFFRDTIKNSEFELPNKNNNFSPCIKILIQETTWIEYEPFNIIMDALNDKVTSQKIQVKVITPEGKEKIEKEIGKEVGYNYNFAIFDRKAFRLEFDANNYRALASFNSESWSTFLLGLFDEAFNSAIDITINLRKRNCKRDIDNYVSSIINPTDNNELERETNE